MSWNDLSQCDQLHVERVSRIIWFSVVCNSYNTKTIISCKLGLLQVWVDVIKFRDRRNFSKTKKSVWIFGYSFLIHDKIIFMRVLQNCVRINFLCDLLYQQMFQFAYPESSKYLLVWETRHGFTLLSKTETLNFKEQKFKKFRHFAI